jgi:hypothetical protein
VIAANAGDLVGREQLDAPIDGASAVANVSGGEHGRNTAARQEIQRALEEAILGVDVSDQSDATELLRRS